MSVIKDTVSGIFGGGDAAKDAGAAQAQAAQAGVQEQRRQFNVTQKNIKPFLAAGRDAVGVQQALLGLGGADAQQQAFANFEESPAQRFLRQRQEQALLRNTAAIGGLGGGNVRTALQEQAAGIAGQQYGDYYNRIANLAGSGQNAAATLGGIGANTASNIQQGLAGAGQATASGILGAQQANSALGGQLLGTGLGAAAGGGLLGTGAAGLFGGSAGAGSLIGLLSDKNKKTNVSDLSPKECYEIVQELDLKAWQYLEETGLDQNIHFGPMSQDAPECIKIPGHEMLNVHDELMLIAGALQYAKKELNVCLH